MIDVFNEEVSRPKIDAMDLVQGILPTRAPDFCHTPVFYINGVEKMVKIGRSSFNYIDYLEAWQNIDCGTYRSRDSLREIELRIKQAFETVKNS